MMHRTSVEAIEPILIDRLHAICDNTIRPVGGANLLLFGLESADSITAIPGLKVYLKTRISGKK